MHCTGLKPNVKKSLLKFRSPSLYTNSGSFAYQLHNNNVIEISDDSDDNANIDSKIDSFKPYPCRVCGIAFEREHQLRSHEQIHIDRLQFRCQFCQRLFKYKRSRDRHTKLHTGDKRYKCDQCTAAFTRSDHLKGHLKSHDKDRVFTCTTCKRSYSTEGALSSHRQIHLTDSNKSVSLPALLTLDEVKVEVDNNSDEYIDQQIKQEEIMQQINDNNNNSDTGHTIEVLDLSPSGTAWQELQHPLLKTFPHLPFSIKCTYCSRQFDDNLQRYYHLYEDHNLKGVELATTLLSSGRLTVKNEDLTLPQYLLPQLTPTDPMLIVFPNDMPSPHYIQDSNLSLHETTLPIYTCNYCTVSFNKMEHLEFHMTTVHLSLLDSSRSIVNEYTCASRISSPIFVPSLSPSGLTTMSFTSSETETNGNNNDSERPTICTPSYYYQEYPIVQSYEQEVVSSQNQDDILLSQSTYMYNQTAITYNYAPSSYLTEKQIERMNNFIKNNDGKITRNNIDKYLLFNQIYACTVCCLRLPRMDTFITHMETHVTLLTQINKKCGHNLGPPPHELTVNTLNYNDSVHPKAKQMASQWFVEHINDVKTYYCAVCNENISNSENFYEHLYEYHTNALLRCKLCNEQFNSKDMLDLHVENMHISRNTRYQCRQCIHRYFDTKFASEVHIKVYHEKDYPLPPVTAQNIEELIVSIRNNLSAFQAKTAQEKDFKSYQFYCTLCPMVNETINDYFEHLFKSHGINIQIRCYLLNQMVTELAELEKMIERVRIFGYNGPNAITIADSIHILFKYDYLYAKSQPPLPPNTVINNRLHHEMHTCNYCHKNDMISVTELVAHTKSCKARREEVSALIVPSSSSNSTHNTNDDNSIIIGKLLAAGSANNNQNIQCFCCEKLFRTHSDFDAHLKYSRNFNDDNNPSNNTSILNNNYALTGLPTIQSPLPSSAIMVTSSNRQIVNKCNICDEVFESPLTLGQHKLGHCKIIDGNICVDCKLVLNDKDMYYSHLFLHSLKSNNNTSKSNGQVINELILPVNCVICGQTLHNDVEIELHANLHIKEQPKSLVPIASSPPSPPPPPSTPPSKSVYPLFYCHICNSIFDSKHFDSLYTIVGSNIDQIEFSLINAICNNCVDLITMNNNQQVNEQNPLQLLDEVITTENQTYYQCAKCTKILYTQSDMTVHCEQNMETCYPPLIINISAEDVGSPICYLCKQEYITMEELQVHLITHDFAGMNQYTCYVCQTVYTSIYGLLKHADMHNLCNSPYECDKCMVKFFFRSELENHQQGKHGQLSNPNEDDQFCAVRKQCAMCLTLHSAEEITEHILICIKIDQNNHPIHNEDPSPPQHTKGNQVETGDSSSSDDANCVEGNYHSRV